MGLLKEFKEFAAHGNVVDMAVGIIIGAAFGAITRSLVDDVLMPPIGMLLGGADFSNLFVLLSEGTVPGPYVTAAEAKTAGAVVITYGLFLQTIINFLIIVFAVFLLVKGINRLKGRRKPPPSPKLPRPPVTAPTAPSPFPCRPDAARIAPRNGITVPGRLAIW